MSQDEDDATFTLDDDESPAQPSALTSAPAAEQVQLRHAAAYMGMLDQCAC
jgi:hypothetical protein